MDRAGHVGRRGAIALIGGTGFAAALTVTAPSRASPPERPLDLASAAGRRRAYMLMRGALDERVVAGCVTGRYYGVVDGELTPLFGVVAATFARYRPVADGGYEAVTVEYPYFTDLVTGKAIDRFRNPYTGETVDVPGSGGRPAKVVILPDLAMQLDRAVPGLSFVHEVLPVEARGDDVWFTEVTRTSSAVPGAGKPFRYSESTILHARRGDLADPAAKRVACQTGFTSVVSWRPWLNMADRPGHMMAIGSGRYGAEMDELPPAWLEATRARHPEVLADRAAILAPLWHAK